MNLYARKVGDSVARCLEDGRAAVIGDGHGRGERLITGATFATHCGGGRGRYTVSTLLITLGKKMHLLVKILSIYMCMYYLISSWRRRAHGIKKK